MFALFIIKYIKFSIQDFGSFSRKKLAVLHLPHHLREEAPHLLRHHLREEAPHLLLHLQEDLEQEEDEEHLLRPFLEEQEAPLVFPGPPVVALDSSWDHNQSSKSTCV
ncbi:hypothetical protein Hanom_Chr12g01156511 [Helianthus anomalus]